MKMTEERKAKLQEARKKRLEQGLTEKFVHKGMVYCKIPFEGLKTHYYIYQVNFKWYEVFYTTKNKLPSNESFGKTAYCCMSLDDAKRCLNILESKNEIKNMM